MSILLAFRVYVNVLAFVDKTQLFFPLLITSLRAIKVNPVLKFNQDLLSVQNQLFKNISGPAYQFIFQCVQRWWRTFATGTLNNEKK